MQLTFWPRLMTRQHCLKALDAEFKGFTFHQNKQPQVFRRLTGLCLISLLLQFMEHLWNINQLCSWSHSGRRPQSRQSGGSTWRPNRCSCKALLHQWTPRRCQSWQKCPVLMIGFIPSIPSTTLKICSQKTILSFNQPRNWFTFNSSALPEAATGSFWDFCPRVLH